jgi:endonuclease G, mitochondrial
LKGADKENFKVSVFTGPIFGEDDIPYRGILLPLQFYKVAAMIKKDGKPSVTGYILSQPDEIDDFRDLEGIKDTGFGQFKTYQVPVARIANLTGIRFDKFTQFDPLGNISPNESTDRIEINGEEDIKL